MSGFRFEGSLTPFRSGAELDTPLVKPSSPSARPRASYNEQGGSADEEDKSRSNEKSVTPRPSATRAEDRSVRSLVYANLPSPTLKPSKVVLASACRCLDRASADLLVAETTTVVADTTLSPLLDAFLEDLPAKLVALRQEVYRSTSNSLTDRWNPLTTFQTLVAKRNALWG